MKFLFSHLYPFHQAWYGGGNQIVRGFARELTRYGHEVHISSSGHDEMGIVDIDCPVVYHLSGSFNKRSLGVQLAWQTIQLAIKLRPDLVCCLNSEAALVVPMCNYLKIPVVVYQAAPELPNFRTFNLSTIKAIRYKLGIFLQYLGARSARKVITISGFSSQLAHQNWGIPQHKLTTVGTGLDDVFIGANTPLFRTQSKLGPRFISVGRLTMDQKPLDVMASALKDLPFPWQHWTIVGSGPDEPTLHRKIKELGLDSRTVFAGTLSSVQIASLLEEHDVVLLPSNYESFFLTAYEAAAKGKIVVTNDVADVQKYFSDSPSVIIAESVSKDAYRQAIIIAVENRSDLESHASKVALRVKNDFSWPEVANRFLHALE